MNVADGVVGFSSREIIERERWENHEIQTLTGVTNQAYLIASHIKPWRHAGNDERLSKNNGLLLAPHADFLFDRGFISFGDGRVIFSEVADEKTLLKLGLDPSRPKEVGGFNDQQERFLEFHRREILRNTG